MIINRKHKNLDQSGWEKAENKLRIWIYSLVHELLQSQVTTTLIYKILLILEGVQFFWYGISSSYDFLWDVNFAEWLRVIVQYLQIDYLLRNDSEQFFVAALFVVFAIQIIILIFIIFTTCRLANNQKKTSTILSYALKILSVYGILLNTIFTLPFLHIFLATFICTDDDTIHGDMECYSGSYIGFVVVAVLGLISLIATSLLFNLLYTDLNPCSTIPFAAPRSRLNLFKLALKIIVVIYTVADDKRTGDKAFIAIYAILWLFILALRYKQTPYYNRSVFKTIIAIDSIIFWAAIVGCIHAFIDTNGRDETGLFYLLFICPFIAYGAIDIIQRRDNIFLRKTIKQFKKDTDIEMYVNVIFNLIETRERPHSKMALEGLLKFYMRNYQKKDVVSASAVLANNFYKDEDAEEKVWYTWVKEIMVDAIETHQKSTRLHMLYAYIQREKLQNKFKALYEMMITETYKPNIEEEFSIFRYKNLIEEEMVENDIKNNESKGIDVNQIVAFQNKFVEFQGMIYKSVDLHSDFWKELLENQPDILKLQALGSEITYSLEQTNDFYKKLLEINQNNIKMLNIYGNFLKDIVNDDAEGDKILEKADYVSKSATINKQFVDNDRLKYGENSNTCIITVSGNSADLGTVTNVNNEIKVLDRTKGELINTNVNKIMPKIIRELHDGFMRHYFETSQAKIIGQERTVFPINKKGYMIPCTLMIKVLPTLDEGIKLVGFLKDIEKDSGFMKADLETDGKIHYIMYGGDGSHIHGVTHSCKKKFGISSNLVESAESAANEFTIDSIFPNLLQFDDAELSTSVGVITTIDTTSIPQNFVGNNNESDESEIEEDESDDDDKKYRKAKVRVILVQDETYNGTNVRVLKFSEIDEDDQRDSSLKDGDITGMQKSQLSDPTNNIREGEGAEEGHVKEEIVDLGKKEESVEDQGSEAGSVDPNESQNEEIRALKDFKAMISEKTSPRSIKILSRTFGIIFIALLTLAFVSFFAFKVVEVSDFKDGVQIIKQGYQRHNLMAEINYRVRKLQLLSLGSLTDYQTEAAKDAYETILKDQLILLIDDLSSVQFEIMKATETLREKGVDTVDSQKFILEHQLESGPPRTEERIYTDSIFQYITAASSIRNSTRTQLNSTNTIDSTQKNFFFVRRNGLGPLRIGSEAAALSFYDYYKDEADNYREIFMIFMIVSLAVLVISMGVLVPIVFQVHKTNDRVLSFFGYIPIIEIEDLADKCDIYMDRWLEDFKDRGNNYMDQSAEMENSREEPHHLENPEASYLENSQMPDGEEIDQSRQEGDEMDNSKVANDDEEEEPYEDVPPGTENQPLRNNENKSGKLPQVSVKKEDQSMIDESMMRKDISENMDQNPIANVPESLKNQNQQKKKPDENIDMRGKSVLKNQMLDSQNPMLNSINKSKFMTASKMVASQNQDLDKSQNLQDRSKFVDANKIKENLEKEKKNDEEADYQIDEDRSQKLLNSKDDRKLMVFIQFGVVSVFFIAYFIADFMHQVTVTDEIKVTLRHLKLSAERMPNTRYVNAFTLEEVVEIDNDDVFSYPTIVDPDEDDYLTIDYRTEYRSITETNDKTLKDSQKASFPSQFDNYKNVFNEFNNENLCNSYYSSEEDECQLIADQLLETGISLSVTTVVINSEDVIKDLEADGEDADQDPTNIIASVNSAKFTESEVIVDYIMPPMQELITIYLAAYNDYLDQVETDEIIKFVVYLIWCICIVLPIWFKYLRTLNDKIFRTKGMLNMIPMEIVHKNEALREVFIKGEFLDSVK